MAKAASWACSDAHVRKRGEQTGLDTLVVHAVNDGHYAGHIDVFGVAANALSAPPGDYGRKAEAQRN